MNIVRKYESMNTPAKAAIWFMLCSILQKGIALITTPIFTRILSPEDFGLYTVYLSWADIIIIFVTLRLEMSVFSKGMSRYRDNRSGYVASMQMLTTITTVVCLLLYWLFSKTISSFTELPFFIMIMLILRCGVFSAYDFWMLKERYEYKYVTFVTVVLGLSFLNAVGGIVAVLLFPTRGGEARIISDFVVYFLIGLVLYGINFKRGWKFAKSEHVKYAIAFNLPLIPHYVATYILNQMDRIMIQKMVGIMQAGVYSVAFSAGMMMNIVSASMINAITPWYYEKLETSKFDDVKARFAPFILIVCSFIFFFLLFAPEAMVVLAPSAYMEAVYIIPPIAASIIFSVMYSLFTIPEFYYDANKFSMIASGAAAIFNLISNFVCINLFGYLSAGFTTLGCHMIIAGGHFLYARHVLRQRNMDFFNVRFVLYVYLGVILIIPVLCVLYDYIVLRYSLAFILTAGAVLKKDEIIALFKSMKK